MGLGSNQPLTEMCNRRISLGKYGRYVRLTTLQPACAIVMKSGNLNFLKPLGHSRAVTGMLYLYLTDCIRHMSKGISK